jgi:hypothetical protein
MKSVLFVVFSFLLFSKKTALLKPKLSRTFFDSIEKRDKKRLEESTHHHHHHHHHIFFAAVRERERKREIYRESVERVERERERVCVERERGCFVIVPQC